MPDVLVRFNGLRVVIEGEVGDGPRAAERAMSAARKRVAEGVAHIAVAVVYPPDLRQADFQTLKRRIRDAVLRIAVVTEAGESELREGGVDELEGAMRRAFEELTHEDIVGRAKAIMEAAVEGFAFTVADKKGNIGRMARTLGIRTLPRRKSGEGEEGPE